MRFITRRMCDIRCHLAAVLAGGLLAVAPASAETHNVDVGPGITFTPAELTINVGDTVVWTWVKGAHNVVSGVDSPDGNFASGEPTDEAGTTFEVTFDQAFLDANPMPNNEYPYFCEVHLSFGMTGTIIVEQPQSCAEDITGDAQVNVNDLLDLLAAWGPCGDCDADLTGDGQVNVNDLLDLLAAWGPCD